MRVCFVRSFCFDVIAPTMCGFSISHFGVFTRSDPMALPASANLEKQTHGTPTAAAASIAAGIATEESGPAAADTFQKKIETENIQEHINTISYLKRIRFIFTSSRIFAGNSANRLLTGGWRTSCCHDCVLTRFPMQ